ncbi:FAD/NAD(P)-binding oxidoreductase [Streptomyces spectabilis]|uniref:NAD(P)/FAD-dependent oxidoreductase n=1 Tax=Streptomyces spectabilis TaxID=68270 RepID=A0A516R3W2_STRST|nr:FAD/NAD(P)-binding oxidoreductase [Streptomyces spectabilis]QDQ10351.1 NAD(P)/FAD-dependent oxidoreductase [Streptomyces spectabilis]
MRTVIVVGASLAGLYAVRELRAQGFDGRLVVIGAEPHMPYDRPPLSKSFLKGPGSVPSPNAPTADGAIAAPTTHVPGPTPPTDVPGPAPTADATGPALTLDATGTALGALDATGTALGADATGASPTADAIATSGTPGTPGTPGLSTSTALAPDATDEPTLALAGADELADLDAEWLLGTPASGLDTGSRAVLLADGRAVVGDGVVIATGAAARSVPGPPLAGVHTLRTLDDARALRTALTGRPRRVVVIGGGFIGFIGAETASSCVTLGHDVTVVEAEPLPLVPQLGSDMAAFCADLHRRGGARLLTGTGVAGLRPGLRTATRTASASPASAPAPEGRVAAVELADGRLLPADVVIVGIGAHPNTAWLKATWLDGGRGALGDGVPCDEGCVTVLPEVVAVGDVARVAGVRAEHWTSATEQPRVAVRNLLAGRTVETANALPYFWSDQYGSRLQFAGHRPATATVRVEEGGLAPDAGGFLAVYEHEGRPTAVLAVDRPRAFMRARRELRTRLAATV